MKRKRVNGQGMTEYIIIVALIAIAAIGVMRIFGDSVRFHFDNMVAMFLGEDKNTARKPRMSKKASRSRGMQDYHESSQRR